MNNTTLFTPIRLGNVVAPNRIIMAPLTRMRAGPNRVPTEMMAEYYVQRASAGLIITEATAISQQGTGSPNTPGIYTDEQIAGWKKIVKAVHDAGGRIFLQLWHMGRVSHPIYQLRGALPVAPSAIAPSKGKVLTESGLVNFVEPRALETFEIRGIITQFSRAAENAKKAGFDGVEIHNANGYLLDQFLRDGTNHRTDNYGGSIQNRSRLTFEVLAAVTNIYGAGRVGIRFSPGSIVNDMHDSNPDSTFSYVLQELNRFYLAYAHIITSSTDDLEHGAVPVDLNLMRQAYHGEIIVANGFDRSKAIDALDKGIADAVAFGRLFLANPDLPERLLLNAPLNKPDASTFYGGNEKGYTDYPSLMPIQVEQLEDEIFAQ